MSQPTTSILLNSTIPAAPTGNQNVKPQSDGATPQQSISLYPQKATSSLLGVVVPDGTTITVDGAGVISAVQPSGSANEVLATPDGSSGTASLRVLVAADVPSLPESKITNLVTDLAAKVPTSRTVNGHALSSNVTVSASDLTTGTLPHAQLPTLLAADIPIMVASGTGHAAGAAPDPGATAGTTKFLREDATWVVPIGGSSLYFGQDFAVASTGNNLITLASTPLAKSVSVFIDGPILSPSAYTISGSVITLTSTLSSGNQVVVNWATTNSTPGGIVVSNSGLLGISGWAMNEGSGLTLHDTLGSDTATINAGGAVTWQTNAGLPGTTPLWNGSGFATAANVTPTNFDGTTPFSIALWITTPSNGADSTMLGTLNASGGTFQGWEVQQQNPFAGGRLTFYLINNYPSNAIAVQSTVGIPSGLTYVVVTYDGSRTAAGVKIYFNAILQTNSVAINALSASTASGNPVRFGGRNDGTQKYTGPMAFQELFNFVLTSTQVAVFYAAGPQLN